MTLLIQLGASWGPDPVFVRQFTHVYSSRGQVLTKRGIRCPTEDLTSIWVKICFDISLDKLYHYRFRALICPPVGSHTGGGNGNAFQYPCLRNPMDREAWWATVRGVATKPAPPPGRHTFLSLWAFSVITFGSKQIYFSDFSWASCQEWMKKNLPDSHLLSLKIACAFLLLL